MQDGDYMPKNRDKPAHKCRCSECVEQPSSETALFHASINRLVVALDEKHRRQFVGLLASQFGHGGMQYIARITGLNRQTISRGKREVEQMDAALDGRIRALGGGRHKAEKKTGFVEST